jgi:hypothetical protein
MSIGACACGERRATAVAEAGFDFGVVVDAGVRATTE